MRKTLFALASFLASLQANEEVLLCLNFVGTNAVVEYDSSTPFSQLSMWQKTQYLLKERGYTLTVGRLDSFPEDPLAVKDYLEREKGGHLKILHIDYNWWIFHDKLPHIPKEYLMLVVLEPPTIFKELHTDDCYSRFSKVFTWDDSRVNGSSVLKCHYPVMVPMIQNIVPFSERKFCCSFGADKRSDYPFELYTERKRVIRFFEKHRDDFEFYGSPSWASYGFSTYRGSVEDKIGTLKNYKFSICYENTTHIQGYITEKIFDCFQAGVVPVYLGADNILDYVPANCFIDKRNFRTYEDLYQYLMRITEEEFNAYIAHIQEFLNSDVAKRYTEDFFAITIVNGITGSHLTLEDLPSSR